MNRFCRLLLLMVTCQAYAFSWQDLWVTKDQQAAELMKKSQFTQAQGLFENEAWRASAAYRAGDFKQAAKDFQALNTEQGDYNAGNALAKMGQLEEAIKAYDKALAANPSNQDARYNRALVESLLKKKQEEEKNKQSSNQQDKNQNSNQQENKNQDNQPSDQNQTNQPQDQNEPKEQKQNNQSDQQNELNKNQSDQDQKEPKDNKAQEKESQSSQSKPDEKNKESKEAAKNQAQQSSSDREKQQAKEQWLRLIPDDPGGLLREKFLRDYIRRQRGVGQ